MTCNNQPQQVGQTTFAQRSGLSLSHPAFGEKKATCVITPIDSQRRLNLTLDPSKIKPPKKDANHSPKSVGPRLRQGSGSGDGSAHFLHTSQDSMEGTSLLGTEFRKGMRRSEAEISEEKRLFTE